MGGVDPFLGDAKRNPIAQPKASKMIKTQQTEYQDDYIIKKEVRTKIDLLNHVHKIKNEIT